MKFLFLIITLMFTQPSFSKSGTIYVFPFEFKGFSSSSKFNKTFALILAQEVQHELSLNSKLSVAVQSDIESQLKKEQKKEQLGISENNAIEKIFLAFGQSDSIFGEITKIDNQFHIHVSLIREEKVLTSSTGWSKTSKKDLIKKVRVVVSEMMKKTINSRLPTIYYDLIDEAYTMYKKKNFNECSDMLKAALKYNPDSVSIIKLIARVKNLQKKQKNDKKNTRSY